jgi:hypothetical protein
MSKVVYRVNGKEVSPEELAASVPRGRLRDLLDSGQPPAANSDREFWRGRWNQFADTPAQGDHYARIARARGQDTTGKAYLPSLARFPGDPLAWVSGKGDAEAVIDNNGWGSEGSINRPVRKVAEPLDVPLAADIVAGLVAKELDRVPEADRPGVNVADVREKVTDKHTPRWHKKKGA